MCIFIAFFQKIVSSDFSWVIRTFLKSTKRENIGLANIRFVPRAFLIKWQLGCTLSVGFRDHGRASHCKWRHRYVVIFLKSCVDNNEKQVFITK